MSLCSKAETTGMFFQFIWGKNKEESDFKRKNCFCSLLRECGAAVQRVDVSALFFIGGKEWWGRR
jgi:hypothetical protein